MADAQDSSDSIPATPDEAFDGNALSSPASPGSAGSSEASTPLDAPADAAPKELPKRVPSLRSVSDSNAMSVSNSTLPATLANARRPPIATSSVGSMNPDIRARLQAFAASRMGPNSPGSPLGTSPVLPGGVPASLGLGGVPMRPTPGIMPRSAPMVQTKQSLSERRKMKLGAFQGSAGSSPSATPKLSDIAGPPEDGEAAGQGKLNDFKRYIDAEKGWITFEGAATITRTGVNFSNGQTFSISLDEIEVLDELGKGNYGTVYKVRHAKPRIPRFGPGLTGFKPAALKHAKTDPSPLRRDGDDESPRGPDSAGADGTTGVVMAMKEIRLELEEAKFTTILKELVILHECVSPYIIDFYGAFFQDGAVYMCIEYMDGGSIDKLYAGGIPEGVLRKITYATIMGLKSLKEEHNIIHRDVKPTNILVNTRGQVKICDFGVSGNLVASIAKTNIGCQSYMAPERISGTNMSAVGANIAGTYSVQSDIWSLGLTIIECAMGRYPYPPEVSSTIFSQLSVCAPSPPEAK